MMNWVRQPDGFMLENIPAAMKATNVISHIPREKAMLAALDFLLDGFAVINKRRLLAGKDRTSGATRKC
jgi:hypothetical protein